MAAYEPWAGYGAALVPGAKFWVAVEGHASDPTREPTDRRTGNSFVAAEVWKAADEYLFNYMGFYRIPKEECVHIEGIVDEINESKEDTEMTKTTANTKTTKTVNAKKETTMNVNAKKTRLTRAEWKAQYIANLEAKLRELAPKHEGEELEVPVNLYHILKAEKEGRENVTNLYASELEKQVLALECAEKGWSAEFLTRTQAEELCGVIPEDAEGFRLHGKNVARGYTYYNTAQVEWTYDEPVWDEDVVAEHVATYAQRDAERKATNATKRANQLRREAGMPGVRTKRTKKTTKKAAPKPEPKAEGVSPDVLAAIVAKAVAEALKAANVA